MKAVNFLDRNILVRLAANVDNNPGVYALHFHRLLTAEGYMDDVYAAPYDFRWVKFFNSRNPNLKLKHNQIPNQNQIPNHKSKYKSINIEYYIIL